MKPPLSSLIGDFGVSQKSNWRQERWCFRRFETGSPGAFAVTLSFRASQLREFVTDILPKMAVNDGTSALLQFATDFSFLTDGVSLNCHWVIRVFRGEIFSSPGGGGGG